MGVLGLGNVGQAVVRVAAASAADLRRRGIAVSIDSALVRDVARRRQCPKVPRVTNNVEAFMRGRYDVVIDALAGCDPAGTIAGRLLGKGIPVVSANKVLIAAEGPRLRGVAARAGTSLRVEASVLAGVPFIGAFERRPLAGQVTRVAGILNGTSNFILSKIAEGAAFDQALAEAQKLGYAEPNPAADISGRDAREKLVVLAEILFGATIKPDSIETRGIEDITPDALGAAAALGGVLKPIVSVSRRSAGRLAAHAGPAWLPGSHTLAGVSGRENAIVIDTRFNGRLTFQGPGAGADVTAATLLDDAVEAAGEKGARVTPQPSRASILSSVRAPETGWFARVCGPRHGLGPFVTAQVSSAGLAIEKLVVDAAGASLVIAPAPGTSIAAVRAAIQSQGLRLSTWRALHD